MKTCTVCRKLKPAQDFQVRRVSPHGRTSACRDCLHERDARRYEREREARLARQKAYRTTPKGRAAHRRASREWIEKNLVKRAAHILVGNAIKSGALVRQSCEVCGSGRAQAHHDDYTKPLEVRWLCRKHHLEHHKGDFHGHH